MIALNCWVVLQVVDWLGRQPGQQQQIGGDALAPLLAEQLDMDSREQIAEALTTGVRVSERERRRLRLQMHMRACSLGSEQRVSRRLRGRLRGRMNGHMDSNCSRVHSTLSRAPESQVAQHWCCRRSTC